MMYDSLASMLVCVSAGAMLGVDLFAMTVLTPALKNVDDHVLTMAMGSIHEQAARSMPVLFMFTLLSAIASFVLGGWNPWLVGGMVLSVLWITLLGTQVLPLNNVLRQAHTDNTIPEDVRSLQRRWDRLIYPRLVLLTCAMICYLMSVMP